MLSGLETTSTTPDNKAQVNAVKNKTRQTRKINNQFKVGYLFFPKTTPTFSNTAWTLKIFLKATSGAAEGFDQVRRTSSSKHLPGKTKLDSIRTSHPLH